MQTGSEGRSSSPDLPEYDSDDDAEEVDIDGIVVPPSHVVNERAIWLEQQQAGQVIFTPNSNKLLIDMLDEVYTQLQPRRPDLDARQSVIQFITKFVNHKIPGSSISAFGSFVMDLFTSSSDLDLSLNVADGRSDRSRNDKVHYLRKVAKALYGLQNGLRQSVQKIETVYRAAVPVVKFVEFKTGIECDISVENNDGVLKSQVLGMFSTMDSRFRQLCYLVKAWAKKHNVNSSKNGTLNSLSICLLVAFHLQTCSPPILPPFSVFMEGLQLSSIPSSLQTVKSRVREHKVRGFGRDNTESVPELFASFFLKLIAVESLWGQGLCSSTYEGRWISKIWPKNHIGCISVEDFADRTQNVARSVSRKEFELIYQVLQSTVSNLKDPVLDVLEAKDLKAYLFGSIRQRHHHKGAEHHEVVASHGGRWQGGNGWSSSPGDSRRTNNFSANGRGNEAQTDSNSPYSEGTAWVNKGSQPVYASRPQGGRGPGQRANSYRKVEHQRPARAAKVAPSFDVAGNGDYRGAQSQQPPYVQYMQYPPLSSTRSNPVQDIKRVAAYKAGYRDHSGYGKEDYPTQSTAIASPGYSGGGYVHRDVDFPTIDADQRGSYPGSVAYPTAEPSQVGRMTYATAGSRTRSDLSAAPNQVQVMPSGSGHHQYSTNQRTGGHHHNRSRRGQRNRANNHPGSEGRGQQQQNQQQQYNRGDAFANGQWQTQASPSNHQFLVR